MSGRITSGTYLEDYVVGDVFRHARGKTVMPFDGASLALLTMNSSDGHFNDHAWGRSVVFGGLTLAFVVGLTMQDTAEHATAELSLHDVRFTAAVHHGDTLYAVTEVLAVEGDVVRFRHWGFNQDGVLVVTCERRVAIERRPADG